jgi:hypothetical protein
MSQLLERHAVRCPYHLAQRYLADSLEGRAESGTPGRLELTVSGPGIELTKSVVATFAPAEDPMRFDQPWRIHWKPQAGPYPEFEGELTVRADETYETSLLELRGSYRPPGGALGAAFDWAAGARIATATARALLARIGDKLELRYRSNEQAKHSSNAS